MTSASTGENPAARDGLRGLRLVFAATSMFIGVACANLDMGIMQNALPVMSGQMHISASASVWIITVYMLVSLTLLLPFARLSDGIGYRRSYLIGLAVFVLASLGCGLSMTLWQLQIGRVLQGVGSAAMLCSTTSLIKVVYPRAYLARAIASNATVVAVSFAAAPSLSALILTYLSWHWLFLINVPLGIIAYILGVKNLPFGVDGATSAQDAKPADWAGAARAIDWIAVVLNIVFFALLLLGTETLATEPLDGVVMLAVACVAATFFVRRQLNDPRPMLPFELLKQRHYAFTIATSFASFAAQGAAFVSLPFYLQHAMGLSEARAALVLTAWPLTLAIAAQVASRLTHRVAIPYLCAAGQALMTAGLMIIVTGVLANHLSLIAVMLALCGAGFGLFQTPNNYVIIASAPAGSSGNVSALRAATRTSGQLIGSALSGVIFLVSHRMNGTDGAVFGIALSAGMALWAGVFSLSRRGIQVPTKG